MAPYDIPDFANLLRIMLRTVKKLRRVIRLISRATSAVAAYAEISIHTKLAPQKTTGKPIVFYGDG